MMREAPLLAFSRRHHASWGQPSPAGTTDEALRRAWRSLEVDSSSTISPAQSSARSPKLARVEAALFVADAALSAKRLYQVAALEDVKEAQALVEELNAAYDRDHSAFRVEKVAAGYQLLTRSEFAPWLDRVHHRQERLKLSPSALETLAVIAHRQPCTRADVEAVRGVQCAEMIKQLMERNLVRVAGEHDSLGRPYLYGTTRLFLESYGLSRLEDLPLADALRKPAPEEQAAA